MHKKFNTNQLQINKIMDSIINATVAKIEDIMYLKSNQELSKGKINELLTDAIRNFYSEVKETSKRMTILRCTTILNQL